MANKEKIEDGQLYGDDCYACGAEYLFWTEDVYKNGLCHICSVKKIKRLQKQIVELQLDKEKRL